MRAELIEEAFRAIPLTGAGPGCAASREAGQGELRFDAALPKVAPRDLDIEIVGQLAAAQLALGDQFQPGPLPIIGFEAALRRRGLIEQPLEHSSRDADAPAT